MKCTQFLYNTLFFLGSTVPPLHAAAAVKVEEMVYILGGQRLDTFSATSDFYTFDVRKKEQGTKCVSLSNLSNFQERCQKSYKQ